MKHFNYFILALIFLISLTPIISLGQQVQFADIFLEPDTIRDGKYKNLEAYDLGYMILYKKSKKSDNIRVTDKSTDQELYSFSNSLPSSEFEKPRFFRSDSKEQPIIMLLDVADYYSYGVHIFLIGESGVIHVGFLEFAADNFNFSSLALYTHIYAEGNRIFLTFDEVDLIDHKNESIVKGSELKFEISNNSVRRIPVQ